MCIGFYELVSPALDESGLTVDSIQIDVLQRTRLVLYSLAMPTNGRHGSPKVPRQRQVNNPGTGLRGSEMSGEKQSSPAY
jgi:hypothetical protein